MIKSVKASILCLTLMIAFMAYSFLYFAQDSERSPVVRTNTGNVQGLVAKSRNGRTFYLYLGIPFARPPIGNLRFESPQSAKSWNGTLDVVTYGPACKGFDFFFLHRVQGEESCLFLNVYASKVGLLNTEHVSKKVLPVIVHIHGGGFHLGSAQMYDGKFFMDHDVVLVTFQYRLGIFGFLSSNDEIIKGNMGLKDQVMAIKWVRDNIINFGGDPTQITIMGDSAGGASVQLLMLSPMAKGLFHRAITMNVVGASDIWQFSRDSSKTKEAVAKYFKCPTESEGLLQCLRQVDEDSLALYHSQFGTTSIFNNVAVIGPGIETHGGPEAFLSQNPFEMIKSGQIATKVPWMVGSNKNEGLFLLAMLLKFMDANNLVEEKNWENVLPNLLFYDKNKRPDAAAKIKQHVFGNADLLALEEKDIIRKLSTMITEKVFFQTLVTSAKLHAKSAPVHMYLYTYEGFLTTFNFLRWASPIPYFPAELVITLKFAANLLYRYFLRVPQEHFGASHEDDVLLLFQYPKVNTELFVNYFDLEMSELLVETYVGFASSGKPNFQGLTWPAINSTEELMCMELNTGTPTILCDPFKSRLEFWEKLNLPNA